MQRETDKDEEAARVRTAAAKLSVASATWPSARLHAFRRVPMLGRERRHLFSLIPKACERRRANGGLARKLIEGR
jgi:hypothetical protein